MKRGNFFTQSASWKLEQLKNGDKLIFYSNRDKLGGKPVRKITAKARVTNNTVKSFKSGNYKGFSVKIEFYKTVKVKDFKPLIPKLNMIPKGSTYWGLWLRSGLREIDKHDWDVLTK